MPAEGRDGDTVFPCGLQYRFFLLPSVSLCRLGHVIIPVSFIITEQSCDSVTTQDLDASSIASFSYILLPPHRRSIFFSPVPLLSGCVFSCRRQYRIHFFIIDLHITEEADKTFAFTGFGGFTPEILIDLPGGTFPIPARADKDIRTRFTVTGGKDTCNRCFKGLLIYFKGIPFCELKGFFILKERKVDNLADGGYENIGVDNKFGIGNRDRSSSAACIRSPSSMSSTPHDISSFL